MTVSKEKTVPSHLWDYALSHTGLQAAAKELRQLLSFKLSESGTDFQQIESRAKGIKSYSEKAVTRLPDKTEKYTDPARQIMDTVAARIIVYTVSARNVVRDMIVSTFTVLEEQNPGDAKKNGYDSLHFVVSGFLDPLSVSGYVELKKFFEQRPGIEIQVRTVASHAWAEYEHDIRYKPGNEFESLSQDTKQDIGDLFFEAALYRRNLDEAFDRIEAILRPFQEDTHPEFTNLLINEPLEELESELTSETRGLAINSDTLKAFLSTKYPNSPLQTSSDLENELRALSILEIQNMGALEKALDSVDSQEIASLMGYQEDPGAERRFDDDLLARFGEEYISRLGVTGQSKLNLEGRLRRVRGKTLIYSVENAPKLEGRFFTATQLFRELTGEVARAERSPAQAAVEGLSSTRRTDLDASARPRQLKFPYGSLWVASNRTRAALEQGIIELAQKYSTHIVLRRAGDVFYPEAQ